MKAAAKAKQALLNKARAKAPANDPEFAKRQAARRAVAIAREARVSERKAAKLAAKIRETAEQEAREAEAAEQAAEQEARETEAAEQAAREIVLEAERKAARDARYAARKARQR